MKKQETIEEKEKRDSEAYARIPSQASEFAEWEPEQFWDDDEEGDPQEGIQQTAATGERVVVTPEALEQAAAIRYKLEGRHHSDNTQLVQDRRGTNTGPRVEQEFTLEGLLPGVTKENRHSEVDYGGPVGKEKMLDNYNAILCSALALSPDERASIAGHLLESLNPPNQEIDATRSEKLKVLEYKHDLDALVRDIDAEKKFAEHISLVVCWKASGDYAKKLLLKPFLIGDSGGSRLYFGSTHNAYFIGQYARPVFEVVILEDLCNFLLDSESEMAKQKIKYEIAG